MMAAASSSKVVLSTTLLQLHLQERLSNIDTRVHPDNVRITSTESSPSGLCWYPHAPGLPGLGMTALGQHAAHCRPMQCRWCTGLLHLSVSHREGSVSSVNSFVNFHASTSHCRIILHPHGSIITTKLLLGSCLAAVSYRLSGRIFTECKHLGHVAALMNPLRTRAITHKVVVCYRHNYTKAIGMSCRSGPSATHGIQQTHHQMHAVLLNIFMSRRCNAGIVWVCLLALSHARVPQLLC